MLKMLSLSTTAYKAIFVAVLVLGTLGAGYGWHRAEVKAAVEASRSAQEREWRVTIDEQRKRLLARSEASQRDMQSALVDNKRKKDAEIKKLNSDLASLRDSVRNRPERPANSASNSSDSASQAGSTQGATGLSLYRSDAEFLIKYSGMAAELQSELKACIRDYDSIRQQLLDYVSK